MITINQQPADIHSSGNDNWWVFDSNLRFAPNFYLKVAIKDATNGSLFNTVLIPTNPGDVNILNIKNIVNDYCLSDFNTFTTIPIINDSTKKYILEVSETFEGFYIMASSTGGTIATCSVINNNIYKSITTPINVTEINFLGGTVSTPISDIYVYDYATASNGYINQFTLSRSPTQSIAITASVGANSPGYLVLDGYPIYSIGATTSTTGKWATKANIDYLDYNTTNNFTGRYMFNSSSKFLTNALYEQDIQKSEWGTLTFIQSTTQSVNYMYVVDSLGATYSKSLSFTSSTIKIDIPTGTSNLTINPNAKWYDVRLESRTGTASTILSETKRYNIKCLNTYWTPIRLAWVNSLGGIDYYTFKFVPNSSKRIERNNFDKNILYNSTKQDRGISTYKLNDYDQYTVVSELIDEKVSNWLTELFTSAEVFWVRGTELIPVTLLSDTYERNIGWEWKEVQVQFRLSRTNRQ